MADDDLLDFRELVDAPDTAVREPMRTNLATEAWRHTDESDGQFRRFDDLIHPHRCERMLTGRDEIVLVWLDSVHHGLEVLEVGDALVGFSIHHQRRLDKCVASTHQEVGPVLLEGHLQPR